MPPRGRRRVARPLGIPPGASGTRCCTAPAPSPRRRPAAETSLEGPLARQRHSTGRRPHSRRSSRLALGIRGPHWDSAGGPPARERACSSAARSPATRGSALRTSGPASGPCRPLPAGTPAAAPRCRWKSAPPSRRKEPAAGSPPRLGAQARAVHRSCAASRRRPRERRRFWGADARKSAAPCQCVVDILVAVDVP